MTFKYTEDEAGQGQSNCCSATLANSNMVCSINGNANRTTGDNFQTQELVNFSLYKQSSSIDEKTKANGLQSIGDSLDSEDF
jgi:hypothetical protein